MTALEELAATALGKFPAPPPATRLRLAAESFNTVFAGEVEGTPRFALRVGAAERIHPEGTEQLEADWMRALARDGIPTAPVYDAADGNAFAWAEHGAVPEPRICMLFGWLDGVVLRDGMTADRARALGALAARLHEHASSTKLDRADVALRADRVITFLVPENLPSMRATHGSLFDEALERATAAVDHLWADPPHAPHLLHGDLRDSNVLDTPDGLVPIDFQDLILGFDGQDLAITLDAFDRFADATTLEQEFQAGYEAVRAWPELDPELWAALRGGRQLNLLNFGIGLRRPGFEAWREARVAAITAWMAS